MDTRFEAVEKRLDAVEAAARQNTRKLDSFIEERIEGYIKSIDQKWREAIDIHERLAALEAKLETR
jgi:hypothetical protein